MKTTGLFTTHRVEIQAELGRPFYLIPFGDVHRESDMHAADHWQSFLARASRVKDAIFLGMGDYTDGVSTSERIILGDAGMHDTTKNTMKDVYKGVVKTLANELGFMRGRVLGLIGGNHYFDFGSEETTDHLLAAALRTKFLGVCSFIRVEVSFKGRGRTTRALDIFAHHGKGGGQLAGSTFNTVEKMASITAADFYLMGHDHGKGAVPASPRLIFHTAGKRLGMHERTPWLGRTGSFLKAYEPGRVSYNVDVGRKPVPLGWIEFEITPRRVRSGNRDDIVFDIRGTS